MPIDYDKLKAWPFGVVEQSYTEKDTILYALGLGLGASPLDAGELRYTFEEANGFATFPTMPVVLGTPGFWARDPDSGLDWKKILHGEQGLEIHGPIPTNATVEARNKIVAPRTFDRLFTSSEDLRDTDNVGFIETGTEVITGDDCSWTVTYTFKVVDDCGNELTGQTYSHTGSNQDPPIFDANC